MTISPYVSCIKQPIGNRDYERGTGQGTTKRAWDHDTTMDCSAIKREPLDGIEGLSYYICTHISITCVIQ